MVQDRPINFLIFFNHSLILTFDSPKIVLINKDMLILL